jgi:hypothetical protein
VLGESETDETLSIEQERAKAERLRRLIKKESWKGVRYRW